MRLRRWTKFLLGVSIFNLGLAGWGGCAGKDYKGFYRMDLRSYGLPVMLNQEAEAAAGRKFRAVVAQESQSSASTYYGYDYNLTVTTTTSKESTQSVESQILLRQTPNDAYIRVDGIDFFHHIMMAPYQGENQAFMGVDVTYVGR